MFLKNIQNSLQSLELNSNGGHFNDEKTTTKSMEFNHASKFS